MPKSCSIFSFISSFNCTISTAFPFGVKTKGEPNLGLGNQLCEAECKNG